MFRLPHLFLRIWLILSLLVLPLDASLGAIAFDAQPEAAAEMTSGTSHAMHRQATQATNHTGHASAGMASKCPCQNSHCAMDDCSGMSHCASGHCSVTALLNVVSISAEPQGTSPIASSPSAFFALNLSPADRPPISPLS